MLTTEESSSKAWREQALERCFAQERSFLFRLARSQLRDDQAADDAVQETAIAAWQGLASFEGRASLRTWLVSILRFKILDSLRQRQRQPVALTSFEIDDELAQCVSDDLLFNAQGQWADMPQDWALSDEDTRLAESPEAQLQHKQMLGMLQTCLTKLPEKTAHVF